MSSLLGLLGGIFCCLDGAMGVASADAWRRWITGVAGIFPEPVPEYTEEIVDITERYREQAPGTIAVLFGIEIAFGLLLIRLATKRR